MTDSEDYFTKRKRIDGNILKKAMDDRTDLLKLLDFFNVSEEELIINLVSLFPKIFNHHTVKFIKNNYLKK